MPAERDEVYAGYTVEELGRQYDIEAASPGFGEHLRRYGELSAQVRSHRRARLDLRYGDGPAQTLDVYPAESGGAAPVIAFIHGGGWRGSNKESRAFPADLYCPAGAVWISMEYPLAPAHTLDRMTDSIRAGIAWVRDNAAEFGGDPRRLVVVGNSAGGHLAAVAATAGEAAGALAGLVTISGVFDMKPLQLMNANSWLRMDDACVLRNSPIRHIPHQPCPLVAFVGEREPAEFRRQSRDFAAAWEARGGRARYAELAGHDHFSIIGLLAERESEIARSLCGLAGLTYTNPTGARQTRALSR